MAEFDVENTFKCNTCKSCFATTEKIKDHYRGDWHILNSKRRAQALLPLKRSEFKELVKLSPKRTESSAASVAPSMSVASKRVHKPKEAAMELVEPGESGEGEGAEGEDEDDEWEDMDSTAPSTAPQPVAPNVSIFDDKLFESTDECVQYMAVQFGFFLPDVEYLSDLDGLLTYLGEKVKLGGYCLYCQKQFAAGRACQNHMLGKSHCKLRYCEGVDLEEYEDFYDFSAQAEEEEEELDEDGNVIERSAAEISSTGELVLRGGKTLGHRDFRLYYKQYYRPAEARMSVLAAQREELLRLGGKFGGLRHTMEEMEELPDAQIMGLLVKYHKEVRRGMVVEQRHMQRQQGKVDQREYKSKVQAKRSSEQTTMKIRDYHNQLK
jgi:pre-60S factor REI1